VGVSDPFWVGGGTPPVTHGIQFCGPLQFGDLLGGWDDQRFKVPSNSDVFILDCEGFDRLSGETEGLRKAVIAAATIANVNILVLKQLDMNSVSFIRAILQ
jgi:hypothetical protein